MPNKQVIRDFQRRERELRLNSMNPQGVQKVLEAKESYVKKDDLAQFQEAITRMIARMSVEIDNLKSESQATLSDTKRSINAQQSAVIDRFRKEFKDKIDDIEKELGVTFNDIEGLKNGSKEIPKGLIEKINSFVVQRSVSIPVTVDQGGTGAITAAQARTNLGITGATGDTVTINSGNYLYFGDSGTDGSWRIYVSGNNLVVERRESAVWVEKSAFLAS